MDINHLYDVQGKRILITGGGGKLGGMMARALLSAGARVYITGRKKESVQQAAAAHIETANLYSEKVYCVGLQSSLDSTASITQLIQDYSQHESGLDVLINNAAMHMVCPTENSQLSDWQNILNINVAVPYELCRQFIPLLKSSASKEDPSRVINIGSAIADHVETMSSQAYAVSKSAVEYLSRVMAHDLASSYISVNCLVPGVFPSPMFTDYLTPEFGLSEVEASMPMKKMGGEADIAGTIVYLCSKASAYMTGSKINLDGGDAIR